MIRFKTLAWSYAFSYGANNKIDFSQYDLTQLVGKNGHGKSSIALILEEVLYNKNSKNIKRGDILNRYSSAKAYTIELEFSKDADDYYIKTVRGSTQSVLLEKNGEDISCHTSTATYKLIEEILGMDHKTFTQIVYQSSAASLEFLTATDTNRKKFLIELLNLSKYTEIAEIFKGLAKDASNVVDSVDVKLSTVKNWLSNLNKEDLVKKELHVVPSLPSEETKTLLELKSKLENIVSTNKKITQNNTYKNILNGIDLSKPTTVVLDKDITQLKAESLVLTNKISSCNNTIKGVGPIKERCDYCGQSVDVSHKKTMVEEAKAQLPALQAELDAIKKQLTIAANNEAVLNQYKSNVQEWERYHSLIDASLQSDLLDRDILEKEIKLLTAEITRITSEVQRLQQLNTEIIAHNTKVDVIVKQIDDMKKDAALYTEKLATATDTLSNLQILTKTFSTTGLVAYKLECSVKDLEELTNAYLTEMSDGRFQLSFRINSSDKLNVVITDNGMDIDILALSNGERARVNVSTLLAIRKLMQNLSDTRINLLILDETIESLDADGKERLIELLLKEEHLNTMLVSHGFTHPLLEKISIVKENNISRIE